MTTSSPAASPVETTASRGSLLLIGPLPIDGDQLGGAKVAFRQMTLDLAERDDLRLVVVNLSRPQLGRGALGRRLVGLRAAGAVLRSTLRHGRASDAWALNCSSGGVFTLFPPLWLLARLMRRPLVLRVFGGNLDERHDRAPALARLAFRAMAVRCRAVVVETRALAERFDDLGNVRRLPNTRSLPPAAPPRERCTRLIFLGQISDAKGVGVLLDGVAGLAPRCTVDCYGTALDIELLERLERQPGIAYRGRLEPDRVGEALRDHDALVLPTFWDGEGLPGVLVEAFQCGRPVIASDWRRIPELVEHESNGLLVEPRSAPALRAAIERLATDPALYARLCAGARISGERWRSDVWHERFVDWCLT